METSNITAAVFTAYLQCPTKGLFIARGENPPQTFFLDLQNNIFAHFVLHAPQCTLLRRYWELTASDHLREELVNYNMEDCRATELVADAVKHICGNGEQAEAKFHAVNISSLEV